MHNGSKEILALNAVNLGAIQYHMVPKYHCIQLWTPPYTSGMAQIIRATFGHKEYHSHRHLY